MQEYWCSRAGLCRWHHYRARSRAGRCGDHLLPGETGWALPRQRQTSDRAARVVPAGAGDVSLLPRLPEYSAGIARADWCPERKNGGITWVIRWLTSLMSYPGSQNKIKPALPAASSTCNIFSDCRTSLQTHSFVPDEPFRVIIHHIALSCLPNEKYR